MTTKITAKRLFPGRIRATNPRVVIVGQNRVGNPTYTETEMPGRFFRVSPQCEREVLALQMMENQYDKFPPAMDNGIIVSAEALERLDAKL